MIAEETSSNSRRMVVFAPASLWFLFVHSKCQKVPLMVASFFVGRKLSPIPATISDNDSDSDSDSLRVMSGSTPESIPESTLKNTLESTLETTLESSLESTQITQRTCQSAPMSIGRADTIFLPNWIIFNSKVSFRFERRCKLSLKFNQNN